MSDKIKVLVVDDSSVVRKFIVSVLSKHQGVEVVGQAENGQAALDFLSKQSVDIMTLDVEMPVLDGLSTLAEIRKRRIKLPIIMCSTLTERGARTTIQALGQGASDYIPKPTNLGGGDRDQLSRSLLEKVLALGKKKPINKVPRSSSVSAPSSSLKIQTKKALGIGVSTGGPSALLQVFQGLKRDLPVPVFVTQHMPPIFTKMLADRLDKDSRIVVREAVDGEVVKPNHAYVAPGDFHLEVVKRGSNTAIKLTQAPPENSCRPAVDVMFRSLASSYGNGLASFVMTGMGSDGAKGAKEIVAAGGDVLIQDEESCAVWGMPGAVAQMKVPHTVVSLQSIADLMEKFSGLK